MPNDPFRYTVCKVLKDAGDTKAAAALEALVTKPEQSRNPNVLRIRAVQALATCGTAKSVDVVAPWAQTGAYFNGLTGIAVDTLAALAKRHKSARKKVDAALKKAYPPVPVQREARAMRACVALAKRVHKARGSKRSFPADLQREDARGVDAMSVRDLPVPPGVSGDDRATEMIRVWLAHEDLWVSLFLGMYEDADDCDIDERDAWGMLLSDIVKHIANGLHQSHGWDRVETATHIRDVFLRPCRRPRRRRSHRGVLAGVSGASHGAAADAISAPTVARPMSLWPSQMSPCAPRNAMPASLSVSSIMPHSKNS